MTDPVISFTEPTEPHGQARHRCGKGGRAYDTKKNRQRKAELKTYMRAAIAKATGGFVVPFPSGPVRLEVVAKFSCPRGDYRKRTPAVARPHIKVPDVDNVLKWVMDAGTDIAWTDDKQVTEAVAIKVIGAQDEPPGTTIRISRADTTSAANWNTYSAPLN